MVRRIASAYEREHGAIEDLTQDVWLAVWRSLPRLENIEREKKLERLIEAVRQLPPPLKAVTALYLEDLAVKDIATALGISESNTSVRLHRARALLRDRMGEE